MRYFIADPAKADLKSIRAYLKRHGEDGWPIMNRQFRRAFRALAESPNVGFMEPAWTHQPVRFFVVYPYIIAYDPRPKPIMVLGVIHAALDVGRVLKSR
jgi:plasmid stabilization system protein ParE